MYVASRVQQIETTHNHTVSGICVGASRGTGARAYIGSPGYNSTVIHGLSRTSFARTQHFLSTFPCLTCLPNRPYTILIRIVRQENAYHLLYPLVSNQPVNYL